MERYAVITGASAGIGREFAKQLSKQGYSLVLVARRKARLKKLAEQLSANCSIITADLTDLAQCQQVCEAIKDKNVEVFINNAGFGHCGPFLFSDWGMELQMIQLNVQAVHFFTKQMLQQMQEKGYGYILNVASSAGLVPAGPYMAAYYACKSYIASITKAAAAELRECGSQIYLGCLCPGPVHTEFDRVANVAFSLHGISPRRCVSYTLSKMKKRKVVIIPTLTMKLAIFFGRFLPESLYLRIVASQQKKKLSH